jgi:site-specific DNA-methyltransferase (adenine-specific)
MKKLIKDNLNLYNCDCMELMGKYPDNYFDLAIVDPPYGGGGDEKIEGGKRFGGNFYKYKLSRNGGGRSKKYDKKILNWDYAPDQSYFDELFRVSKNQIIWGGNYFQLPPHRCFLVWRKLTISESFSMAMCEYAWCSFNDNAKWIELAPQDSSRFHPTQKPVKLYSWILNNYAKEGDKILDTHLGSGSIAIACHDLKFNLTGCEIDEEYFSQMCERINIHTSQLQLF